MYYVSIKLLWIVYVMQPVNVTFRIIFLCFLLQFDKWSIWYDYKIIEVLYSTVNSKIEPI